MNNPIVIIGPMDCECEYLISKLQEKNQTIFGGYVFCSGKLNGKDVIVIRSLMGTVNAAVCTNIAIEKYSPKCVILQGTAGAHKKELNLGDIVIAKNVVPICNYISKKRSENEGYFPFDNDDFGIESYSKNSGKTEIVNDFNCDENLVNIASSVSYQNGKVHIGTVGTGDVWNKETDLINLINKTKGTLCEAMEGVAVAQVCQMYAVPMIEIRVISNNELQDNTEYSKDTAVSCQQFVCDFLDKL